MNLGDVIQNYKSNGQQLANCRAALCSGGPPTLIAFGSQHPAWSGTWEGVSISGQVQIVAARPLLPSVGREGGGGARDEQPRAASD